MKTTLIADIAKYCEWHKTTVTSQFITQCEDNLSVLQKSLPSGSGFDAGCKIDIEKSGKKKVIINFSFHHLNENGYYEGWTDHKLIITPLLYGDFVMRITGINKNDIKDYFYNTFESALNSTGNLPESN